MGDLVQFVVDNWKELFGGIGTAVVVVLLTWWLNRRSSAKDKPSGEKVDVKAVFEALHATYRKEHREELREKDEQIQELTKAVEALEEQRRKPEAPPGIDAALKQLAQGETESAEAIFGQVLERKKAEGEDASKEAAAAARHIGALAYLHDTQKALSAYAQAVDLDPEDPDGWNMLGHLRDRVGDLDGAIAAYGRVLTLGNKVEDKGIIAVAYGNLGLVYLTRGELEKAEEHHRQALALNEELGRKEGMATAYGNLGNIYLTRGELEKAEEHYRESLALNEELGRKEGIAIDYGNLGLVYATRGELEKAEEHHLKSLALSEELGHKEGMAIQYGNLGIVHAKRGELKKAEAHYLKSLELFEGLGHKKGMAEQYDNLGDFYKTRGYKTRGKLQKACRAWAKSRRLFLELGAKDRAEQVQKLMDEAGCDREEDGEG